MYERVPHVTLKSIAQNPDIREGMTREEIDAAIARHAETETLFDRPYEDRKVVRVSGPFTVESLSPHRVLVDGPEDAPAAESPPSVDAGAFVTSILDNLRRAGVQNTKRNERLELRPARPVPRRLGPGGRASTARTARPRRSRSPSARVRHRRPRARPRGRQGGGQVRRPAGRVRLRLRPAGGEEASTLGRLTILQARMNPDLAMGDELLKKTGSGNLFMVFGEPDIEVRTVGGRTSSRSRSAASTSTTRRPARSAPRPSTTSPRWFLDTDYDGDAFFVRHAYFTGADDPYDNSAAPCGPTSPTRPGRRSTRRSRARSRARSGKIAVKVINHYGDEVMKVVGTPLASC